MTKIKMKDIGKLLLKVLPVSPDGNLLVEVENGKRVILYPSKKEGSVKKTSGILKSKSSGVQIEDRLRKEAEKRIK